MSAPVVIFADGSPTIGAGHQVRCAALAEALARRGLASVLACRDLPGSTHARIWAGQTVHLLPALATAVEAVRESSAVLAPAVLVVDHYDLGDEALADLAADRPLVVLDDLAERRCQGAALVLNGAPGIEPAEYPETPCAVGAAWALVRPCFAPPSAAAPRDDRVLVLLGGTDHAGLAPAAARELQHRGARPLVAGAVRGLDPGIAATGPIPVAEVAALMAGCGRGLVSASGAALEALAAGLPLVALRTAGNQARLAQGLAAAGIAVFTPSDLAAALDRLLADPPPAVPALVDGGGPDRAAERLAEIAVGTPAPLRPACWADSGLFLAAANDPINRQHSFTRATIPAAEHRAWMARRLADPDSRLWIGEQAGVPLGVLRLQRDGDGTAVVSIIVLPAARGRGAGRAMLDALAGWLRRTAFCCRVDAWIAVENQASIALFARCGYTLLETALHQGRMAHRYAWAVAAAAEEGRG